MCFQCDNIVHYMLLFHTLCHCMQYIDKPSCETGKLFELLVFNNVNISHRKILINQLMLKRVLCVVHWQEFVVRLLFIPWTWSKRDYRCVHCNVKNTTERFNLLSSLFWLTKDLLVTDEVVLKSPILVKNKAAGKIQALRLQSTHSLDLFKILWFLPL